MQLRCGLGEGMQEPRYEERRHQQTCLQPLGSFHVPGEGEEPSSYGGYLSSPSSLRYLPAQLLQAEGFDTGTTLCHLPGSARTSQAE